MTTISKTGAILSVGYLIVCIALISTQGLFGESFIALILGMPLSLLLALVEFGNQAGVMMYVLILLSIAFNAFLLYWIGYGIELFSKELKS